MDSLTRLVSLSQDISVGRQPGQRADRDQRDQRCADQSGEGESGPLRQPVSVAIRGKAIWVANEGGNSLTEVNGVNGSLVRS